MTQVKQSRPKREMVGYTRFSTLLEEFGIMCAQGGRAPFIGRMLRQERIHMVKNFYGLYVLNADVPRARTLIHAYVNEATAPPAASVAAPNGNGQMDDYGKALAAAYRTIERLVEALELANEQVRQLNEVKRTTVQTSERVRQALLRYGD